MARGKDVEEDEIVEEVPPNAEDDEEEGDEEEYEIEAILDAKHGAFSGGKLGYLVKWKGYGDEHNSWVSQDDAANAQDLINIYWAKAKKNGGRKPPTKTSASAPVPKKRKTTSPPVSDSEEEAPAPKKRGRPPKTAVKSISEDEDEDVPVKEAPPAKKQAPRTSAVKKTKAQSEEPMDEDDDEENYETMERWKDAPSWEHLVDHIDTVERRDDKLYVYFKLKNWKAKGTGACRVESSICKKKMPELLLEFYERNLRWRALGADEEAEERS